MKTKNGILGIDAGGTFTDLAFLSKKDMSVRARMKVPTRHDNLLATIEGGIAEILAFVDVEEIESVHLASTLATNATVENKMAPAGLILIGYQERDVETAIQKKLFGEVFVKNIPGGHDIRGNEREPLDEALLLSTCEELLSKRLMGVALSGYFSVRNPSHEIRARDLLRTRYPGISVTCGHELVAELDAFKRATTASINAGLIPILMRLLEAVRRVLKKFRIDASLSIVKGDGSLVSDEWAEHHPVETIVSGPAASAMGARFLGGAHGNGKRSWILDIGGTTTDIIGLDNHGNPLPKNDGAVIGGHRILIKTIDIRTFGLGGDSRVSRQKDGTLRVGPRRVTPLAVAAEKDRRVIPLLEEIARGSIAQKEPLLFMPGENVNGESALEERLIDKLRRGVRNLEGLTEGETLGAGHMILQNIDKYEERGILTLAAFTPTDALLALGMLDKWPSLASELGARLLAENPGKPCNPNDLCREVCARVSSIAASEVFRKALADARLAPNTELAGERVFLDIALCNKQMENVPNINLKLNANVIGVGAPSWAFMGEIAAKMGEKAILPENAEVAGAVGAAVGTFFLHHTVLITPLASGDFRVHLPDGISDFKTLEEAAEKSVGFMIPWLERLAKEAGGRAVTIEWERQDETARISGGTQEVLLWSRILFSVRERGDDK